MPSWKKVIISGSDAALNSLNVTTSVTASIVSASAGLITDNIQFNTGTSTVVGEGQLAWNPTDGTLDLGMKGGLATQHIGQETYYPPVVNKTAAILREGTLVMVDPIAPSFGNRLSIIKAVTDGTYPTDLLVGIITEDIAINGEGFATWFGYIRNLNENNLETYGIKRAGETWVEGNILYPDPIYPGGLTNVEPSAPALKSTIAAITTVNGVNITLLTRPIFKFKVEELSDVGSTSQNGDLLVKSGSIWTPSKQLSGSYGLTGSLNVQGSITGSLFGTASYATTAGSTTAIAGTDNYVPKFNGTSALENSIIYDNGTNVGIGTTSLGAKLDVNGDGRFQTNLTIGLTTNNNGTRTVFNGSTAGRSFQIANNWNVGGSFEITPSTTTAGSTFTTPALVINGTTSNVGIGTTSPTSKLHIVGDVYTSTGYTAAGNSYMNSIGNTITNNNANLSLTTSGVRTSRNIADSSTVFAVINQNASSTGRIQTWNNSGGELMRVTQNGNVGIGVTTPAYKLHVIDSSSIGTTVGSNVVARFSTLSSGKDSTIQLSDGVAYSSKISMLSGDLHLSTEGKTSALTVKATTGNIGIGTTSPSALLHLKSDFSSGVAVIYDRTQNANIDSLFYTGVSTNGATTSDFMWMGTSTSDMTITGTGNVGIGTTSPNSKLTSVLPSSGIALELQSIQGTLNEFIDLKMIAGNSNSGTLGTILRHKRNGSSGGDFIILTSPTLAGVPVERLTVTKDGNVGIGTTTPGAKLDVEGDVLIKAANLSNQENTDVDTGTEVVATVAIATYTAAFFDFVVKNGTNIRSGTVFACHDGTNVEFTETSTADLGTTSPLTLSVDISSGNMRLLATATTDNWSVKTLVRAL